MENKINKIKKFITSNRLEIFYIFSIFIFLCLMFIFFGKQIGHVIIDSGREVYFPEEMLNGKILYKDIFNIFGPLSYQINAVFYKVFGVSLNVLRFAGFLNATLIVYLLYGISRLFTSKTISFVITIFVISTCVFNYWVFNYIFPYTYAMTYSFSAFLLSVLCLLLYLKKPKQIFIPLSWFFIGASITSKLDYFTYAIILLFLTILMRKEQKVQLKYIFYSLISFLAVPVISFSILFLQGLSLNELLYQLIFIKKYAMSESLNNFYKNTSGLYPSKIALFYCVFKLISIVVSFTAFLMSIYYSLKFSRNIKNEYKKYFVSLISLVISGIILFFSFSLISHFDLCWLPIMSLFLFVFVVLKDFLFKKTISFNFAYIILFVIAISVSLKSFFLLNLQSYGTFAAPLLLLVNGIFLVEYMPKYFINIDEIILKKSFCVVFIVLSSIIVYILSDIYFYHSPIKSDIGTIYCNTGKAIAIQETIDYIKKNIKENKSIWVVPEGVMINSMVKKPSGSFYYNITPPYIEAFGENKIISDTKKNPPDYIIINNRDSSDYGHRYFCTNYGQKICKYIKSSYTPIASFSGPQDIDGIFYMTIYKKAGND